MNITVSLKTAKKLKAAGFPQDDTVMVWWFAPWLKRWKFGFRGDNREIKHIAAPTAEEILSQPEITSQQFSVYLVFYPAVKKFVCGSIAMAAGELNAAASEAAADFWMKAVGKLEGK